MEKSPDAFRTISEVAEFLETPAHVLRFWESRFPQIRPVKRAGGRRYYRPADVSLLTGIKHLLHEEGMTIRGVQKILREQGVRHVAGLLGDDTAGDEDATIEAALAAVVPPEPKAAPLPPAEAETAQIIALQTAMANRDAPEPPAETESRPPDSADDDEIQAQVAKTMQSADQAPAEPAPPSAADRPNAAAPAQIDLFSGLPQTAPPPRGPARVQPKPPESPTAPPSEDAAEAPMEVWADPEEHAPEPPAAAPPVTNLRATANPSPDQPAAQSPRPPEAEPSQADATAPAAEERQTQPETPPMPARLRALARAGVPEERHEELALILAHARNFQARLSDQPKRDG